MKPSTTEHLNTILARLVPQWSPKLRRRWVQQFLPHWREDLLDAARLERYLRIALSRGWFDNAAQAGRWSQFIRLLERQKEAREVTPVQAVNLFNLAALIPMGITFTPENLDAKSWSLLTGDAQLDAEQMGAILAIFHDHEAAQTPARALLSPMLRVTRGEACDKRGARWLSARFSSDALTLVHLVEPFGTKPWDGVSQVGFSDGKLLAYSRPLGLIATLTAPDFQVDVRRGEPSAYTWPDERDCPLEGIGRIFRADDSTWVGLTRDGAVAFLKEGKG